MNCQAVRAVLDLYLEGRLEPAQAGRLESHIEECASCAHAAASFRPAAAPPVTMPPELKERLRKELASAAAQVESDAEPDGEPEPSSPLSFCRDALLIVLASLPIAALVGAGFEASMTLGCLVCAGALGAHALWRGRATLAADRLPLTLSAWVLAFWELVRGAAGPAFALPAALASASGPCLFLAARTALGGLGEARKLAAVAAIAGPLTVAAAKLAAPTSQAPAFDAVSMALTFLVASSTTLDIFRGWRAARRRGTREERRTIELLAFLSAAAVAATATSRLAAPFAWIITGALVGLCGLSIPSRESTAIPFGLRAPARQLWAGALTAGLAALALVPAAWIASDRALVVARSAAILGDPSAALRSLDRIGSHSPTWPQAQFMKGELALDRGDAAAALRELSLVEAQAPEYQGLAYRMGVVYAKLGDWPRALACHKRARLENPRDTANLERLAAAAKTVGDYKLARRTALTLIALDPKDEVHWLSLSDIDRREKLAARAARERERHARRPRPSKRPAL